MVVLTTSCSNDNDGESDLVNLWTWVSGSNTVDQSGTYGIKGTADSANIPGARHSSISWTNTTGKQWLFGGIGYDNAATTGLLNDLWRWDGTNWIWISGSNTVNQSGTYGTKGSPDNANIPGARHEAISWTDTTGNLWLFGGTGFDSAGTEDILNDLWRWNGTNWTWISGSNTVNQSGTYGAKGIANGANIPGARHQAISWIDTSGNLWLFGGTGYDSVGTKGSLNDLWRWDGINWTWISGSNTVNQSGTYGTKGTVDSANIPGARHQAISWTDVTGNLWLFGGKGYDSTGTTGSLNDLWRWDKTNWTWISGNNTVDQPGIYGTKSTADSANIPGARQQAINWIDTNGYLWLFSGTGYDSTGTTGSLNDLWRWDGTNWTWISGSETVNQSGTYGIKGIADSANIPGARHQGISWVDSNGNLLLFGGKGYDSNGTLNVLNDLWRYKLTLLAGP